MHKPRSILRRCLRGSLLWLIALGLLAPMLGQAAPEGEPPEGKPVGEGASASPATRPAATVPATQQGVARPAGANVAIIRIEGMIYDFVLDSLKRRVNRAMNQKASVIVIELHTNGGTVEAGKAIAKYLRTLPVPTVAWVNDKAYSAGIMIGAACDELVMAPASATGDCAPIVPGQEMAEAERQKALSPILAEFRDSARANDYDYAMFHAMCVLGVELYYIEHKQTGERKLVNQVDYELMVHGRAPGGGNMLGQMFGGGQGSGQAKAGAVTREVATDEDLNQWKPVVNLPSGDQAPNGLVHDGKTFLTLTATEAKDIGLSRATIASEQQLRQHLSAAQVQRVPHTWSEDLAGFLTSPVVRGILVVALLLGAYIEFQSPGLGIPGAVAVLALITLLGAPFLIGLAEVWHILAFLLGVTLLIVELVFIPSFGLVGIAGLVLMFVGLVMSVVPTGGGGGTVPLPSPAVYDRLLASLASMMLGLVVSLAGFYFLARYFGSVPLLNKLILQTRPQPATAGAGEQRQQAGTLDRPAETHVAGDEAIGAGNIRVGDQGRVAVTGLRPSGRAEINGQIVDVVSVGGWIEAGRKIHVIEVHGNNIVVDELPRE